MSSPLIPVEPEREPDTAECPFHRPLVNLANVTHTSRTLSDTTLSSSIFSENSISWGSAHTAEGRKGFAKVRSDLSFFRLPSPGLLSVLLVIHTEYRPPFYFTIIYHLRVQDVSGPV